MGFNELKTHGREDFPLQLYKLTPDRPKYVMVNHWHTSIEIIKVHEGVLHLTVNNVKYDLKRGDLFIINAESVHGATPENCFYDCLVFNPKFLRNSNRETSNFLDKVSNGTISFTSYVTNDKLKNTLNELFYFVESSADTLTIIGGLYKTFGVLKEEDLTEWSLPNIDKKSLQKTKINNVLKYIKENYQSVISLDNLAEVAKLTPNYFSYYFKKTTGLSPIDYLISYRIEKASTMLLSTEDPITKIAFDNGFTDLSYFIKVFKAHTGLTPYKYRKQKNLQNGN